MTARERENLIEFAIGKLTERLIQQEFEDKLKKKTTYVKKTRAFKDLIQLLKEVKYYDQ